MPHEIKPSAIAAGQLLVDPPDPIKERLMADLETAVAEADELTAPPEKSMLWQRNRLEELLGSLLVDLGVTVEQLTGPELVAAAEAYLF